MVRQALKSDRAEFRRLWAEFLESAHEAGSDVLPSPRNLQTAAYLFDAYLSGQLVGNIWIAPGIGVSMVGEPAVVQFFDSSLGRIAHGWGTYVRPDHRGTGVASKLRMAGVHWAKKMGFGAIVGTIAIGNEASLRTCEQVGAETLGYFTAHRLGGK